MFAVFGKGGYKVQHIYNGHAAIQAVGPGSQIENFVTDAACPESFTFKELLLQLAEALGAHL